MPRALVEEAEEVCDLRERPEGLAVLGQLSDPERERNDRGRSDVQGKNRPGETESRPAGNRSGAQDCGPVRVLFPSCGSCSPHFVPARPKPGYRTLPKNAARNPYAHLGTGWIGGLLPATAFAIVTANGNIYSGLWYPVFFCTLTAFIGTLFLPETRGREIG